MKLVECSVCGQKISSHISQCNFCLQPNPFFGLIAKEPLDEDQYYKLADEQPSSDADEVFQAMARETLERKEPLDEDQYYKLADEQPSSDADEVFQAMARETSERKEPLDEDQYYKLADEQPSSDADEVFLGMVRETLERKEPLDEDQSCKLADKQPSSINCLTCGLEVYKHLPQQNGGKDENGNFLTDNYCGCRGPRPGEHTQTWRDLVDAGYFSPNKTERDIKRFKTTRQRRKRTPKMEDVIRQGADKARKRDDKAWERTRKREERERLAKEKASLAEKQAEARMRLASRKTDTLANKDSTPNNPRTRRPYGWLVVGLLFLAWATYEDNRRRTYFLESALLQAELRDTGRDIEYYMDLQERGITHSGTAGNIQYHINALFDKSNKRVEQLGKLGSTRQLLDPVHNYFLWGIGIICIIIFFAKK